MFRKLKRKFILYNMTVLTLVFAAIVTVTACFMIVNNNRQTQAILNRAMSGPSGPMKHEPIMMGTITVNYKSDGSISSISAPPQISEETVLEAASEIVLQDQNQGQLLHSGYTFVYANQENKFGRRVVMIDQSFQIRALHDTLLTMLIASLLSLFFLFWVSVIFAGKTIHPIKAAFEKQKAFIADASHELKTPLAVLDANLSVIESNQMEPVFSQKKWMDAMKEQSYRMNSLISDMLTLARLDAKQESGPLYGVDFSVVLTGCLLSFEAVAFEKGVLISSEITNDLWVTGVQERLDRLVYILLDNAVKHTTDGGTVSVTLMEEKGKILLNVKNPSSIAPDALPHIFDRFYRADSARTRTDGGFGLGLAIAKALAEEFSGKISAQSTEGTTSFLVEFHAQSPL